jgi:hypothetical protein
MARITESVLRRIFLFYNFVSLAKSPPACRRTAIREGRTNIFLCEFDALNMGILAALAGGSRRLDIF